MSILINYKHSDSGVALRIHKLKNTSVWIGGVSKMHFQCCGELRRQGLVATACWWRCLYSLRYIYPLKNCSLADKKRPWKTRIASYVHSGIKKVPENPTTTFFPWVFCSFRTKKQQVKHVAQTSMWQLSIDEVGNNSAAAFATTSHNALGTMFFGFKCDATRTVRGEGPNRYTHITGAWGSSKLLLVEQEGFKIPPKNKYINFKKMQNTTHWAREG